ncbi:MAG: ribokinase [Nitrospiraceae bacterium]
MPKVIVVGSSNMDLTIALDRLPAMGETLLGRNWYQSCGGKGANQAIAARRAGADVAFLTKLGQDANGQLIEQSLLSMGIPQSGLLRDGTSPTGVAFILVDAEGRNMIAVSPGSNRTLNLEDVRQASSLITGSSVLLAQLEVPLSAVAEALLIANTHGVMTILNPAPTLPLSSELLSLVDVLTPNEGEARTLTGLADASAAASALREQGAGSVIVTLAERGALLQTQGGDRRFPAYPVKAIDTTAAGDAFNGALACALAEGRSLDDAITFANAAGACATLTRGAHASLPTRDEIDRMSRGRV